MNPAFWPSRTCSAEATATQFFIVAPLERRREGGGHRDRVSASAPATGCMILVTVFLPTDLLEGARRLRDTDAGDRDLLEQVRGSDGRRWIERQLRPELRMRECSPEGRGGFPDRIIEVSRVIADRAMQLGRDEARLSFHELGIVLPGLEEGRLVHLVEREHVYEHDGARVDRDLAIDRESGVQRAKQRHDKPPLNWLYDVNLVQ